MPVTRRRRANAVKEKGIMSKLGVQIQPWSDSRELVELGCRLSDLVNSATNESPYRDWSYTLALQPLSRNPYSRSTTSIR